jgi:predicted permease
VRRSVLTLGGNRHWAHEVEVVVGLIWRLVAQPLLFGIIGSLLGFKNLDIRTLPLSLGLVICGALCVCPSAGKWVPRKRDKQTTRTRLAAAASSPSTLAPFSLAQQAWRCGCPRHSSAWRARG